MLWPRFVIISLYKCPECFLQIVFLSKLKCLSKHNWVVWVECSVFDQYTILLPLHWAGGGRDGSCKTPGGSPAAHLQEAATSCRVGSAQSSPGARLLTSRTRQSTAGRRKTKFEKDKSWYTCGKSIQLSSFVCALAKCLQHCVFPGGHHDTPAQSTVHRTRWVPMNGTKTVMIYFPIISTKIFKLKQKYWVQCLSPLVEEKLK